MTVLQGIGFSPYVEDADTQSRSTPVRCVASFFHGGDLEGSMITFLPAQNNVLVQPAGASSNVNLPLDEVRCIRFPDAVDLKASAAHFRDRGIVVHSTPRAPFLLTYRDGNTFAGELYGYGAGWGGFGVYLAADGQTDGARGVRCYFPAASVESFAVGEQLGKLLLEKQDLTEDGLRLALQAQNRLRAQMLGEIMVENMIVDQENLDKAIREQATRPIRRLGEVLIESGIISSAQLEAALAEQDKRRGKPLGEILIDMGLVDAATIRSVLAQKLGIPHVDLARFRIEAEASGLVPMSLVLRHHAIPLYRSGGDLVVAMENPLDAAAIDALRFTTELKIVPVLATREEINLALNRRPPDGVSVWDENDGPALVTISGDVPGGMIAYDPGISRAGELATQLETELAPGDTDDDAPEDSVRETDNTLVRLVNKIVLDAHEQGVSDIHVEPRPGKSNTRVRFRRDGILFDYLEVPARFRAALVARIKIMANLDISEKRRPQDGKIDFKRFGPARIELRVATIPTNNGLESVVLRILSGAKPISIDRLQLAPRVLAELRALAEKPYGLILVCGPTGSGKTTTLHSVLGYINTPERKIWTAEDPVEITQPGLSQVQVNAKIGWTFALALRAFLRADPDVVMIGEMRDQETAQTSVEASLTGHLVLSTLHTNSAAESVTRLLDMGLDPFNFADALLGVLAQRLARRLCTECRTIGHRDDAALSALADEYCHHHALEPARVLAGWNASCGGSGGLSIAAPSGCQACHGTGYRGRIAVHELLVVTPPIRHLIRTAAPASDIVRTALAEGMRTMKQDGIEKVLQGHTTVEQVRAVCT